MTDEHQEFETLIAYIHGELSADETVRIETRLQADRELCRVYLELAEEEVILAKRANSGDVAQELDERLFGTSSESPNGKSHRSPSRAWAVAIAASVVAVCSIIWGVNERGLRLNNPIVADGPPPTREQLPTPADPDLAGLLVSDAAAVFKPGNAPEDVKFRRQRYILEQGTAHLRLVNGVDLVFRAPVNFTIVDPLRVQLENGSIRATVPDEAHGFVITAPSVDVEDLGTEFGVSVDSATRTSEVHVFDGEVNIRKADRGDVLMSLNEGQAVQVDAKGKAQTSRIRDADFPSQSAVAFARWRLWSGDFRNDPTILCYYPFEPDASKPERLRNVATNKQTGDGEVVDAHWTTGRWPGKKALLFDDDSAFVRVNVPGEYSALTIATWVKIDRIESGITVIFRSDDSEAPGSLRFFLSRRSSMVNGSVAEATQSRPNVIAKGVPTGEWVHLAAVYDADVGTCKSFLNGKLMMTRSLTKGAKIKVRQARLSARTGPIDGYGWQALRGRMDEFVIWGRAVSAEEIQGIVRNTRPSDLQSWTE